VLPDAKAPASYLTELVVPGGLSVRASPAAMELVDATGNRAARFGDGLAYDSASVHNETTVAAELVSSNGGVARIRFSIDGRG